MSNAELTLHPRHSSASPHGTQLELEAFSYRELLGRLKTRIKQDTGEEYCQALHDIYEMTERALAQAESESEGNCIAQKDGVLVGAFIPFMAKILRRAVECVENSLTTRNPERRTSFPRIRSRKLDKNKSFVAKELTKLRNNLEGIYFIAMPSTPPSTSSDRIDDALIIAVSIGGTLSVLCDSVAVLAPLRIMADGLTEACNAVQTLRSNQKLAAEILLGVRDYFRMVVRKIQKYPGAQADEELRKDVEELFKNLLCVQETLLKLKHKNRHVGSCVFFAQKDKERLNALKNRVQESRSTFEASLHLSTNLRVNEVAMSMDSLISRLESSLSSQPLETSMSTLLALPSPSPSPIFEPQGTTENPLTLLQRVHSDSTTKQWVSVQVDLDRASHTKYHHSAVSLLPYAGVYFFF